MTGPSPGTWAYTKYVTPYGKRMRRKISPVSYHAYQLANTKFKGKNEHNTLCGVHFMGVSTTQQETDVTCQRCLEIMRAKLRTQFKRGFKQKA